MGRLAGLARMSAFARHRLMSENGPRRAKLGPEAHYGGTPWTSFLRFWQSRLVTTVVD